MCRGNRRWMRGEAPGAKKWGQNNNNMVIAGSRGGTVDERSRYKNISFPFSNGKIAFYYILYASSNHHHRSQRSAARLQVPCFTSPRQGLLGWGSAATRRDQHGAVARRMLSFCILSFVCFLRARLTMVLLVFMFVFLPASGLHSKKSFS